MFTDVKLLFKSELHACDPNIDGALIVGKLDHLKKVDVNTIRCKFGEAFANEHFTRGLEQLSEGSALDIWFDSFTIAALPSQLTRHNSPSAPHSLCSSVLQKKLPRKARECVTIVCERSGVFPLAAALARNFPLYNDKTSMDVFASDKGSTDKSCELIVDFVLVGDDQRSLTDQDIALLESTGTSIRLAGMIVDKPCNKMNTDHFVQEANVVANELNITPVIIRDTELEARGFGGIFGVGKAASAPPALVILSHRPEGATRNIAWVGKGIVYDTGGLSIKGKDNMPGMKRDCGGAAGILGAFRSAVKAGFSENLHAVLCLAENAVGPKAARPDDVHTMYSGLTVEINNTDAEGRLVLADGVAYAKKDLKCDVIVDMATLTGAQGIATGKHHASIMTNQEDWEVACVKAGRSSGDLAHPMPYTPEFHFQEFKSEVADMKNSVYSRYNGQVSCAGLFIGSHIGFDYPGAWLHIDMASPVHKGERATGYGVALLCVLFGKFSGAKMLQDLAPELRLV